MELNMKKIVIEITQMVLGGLTINTQVTNFLQCICAENYEN